MAQQLTVRQNRPQPQIGPPRGITTLRTIGQCRVNGHVEGRGRFPWRRPLRQCPCMYARTYSKRRRWSLVPLTRSQSQVQPARHVEHYGHTTGKQGSSALADLGAGSESGIGTCLMGKENGGEGRTDYGTPLLLVWLLMRTALCTCILSVCISSWTHVCCHGWLQLEHGYFWNAVPSFILSFDNEAGGGGKPPNKRTSSRWCCAGTEASCNADETEVEGFELPYAVLLILFQDG